MLKFTNVFSNFKSLKFLIILSVFFIQNGLAQTNEAFKNATDFGFSENESGVNNTKALQAAVDKGGTILVGKPGTYKLAGTVYIGDSTSLIFGDGVVIKKVAENGIFCQVILNKGALTKTYNKHISIIGMNLMVNGVENWMHDVFGLRGQLGFFYVKDLKIERFRCLDLGKAQFCLQICTFENLLINDVIIKGKKDGIHLGAGKRFKISNCIFETADDAIALAAGDWVTGNPEFGDIEGGVIENCYDLKASILEGAFAKIVASAWVDWKPGIEVRHSDAVVSDGRIYRVIAEVDGKYHKSITKPTFKEGFKVIDGIKWWMHQADTFHTAVVKNVVFRDIFLESQRVPFQIMCYDIDYAHSYFRGAPVPVQSGIALENISVLNNYQKPLISISSPCDLLSIRNSYLNNNGIEFKQAKDFDSYPKTHISFTNCVFQNNGESMLIRNKRIGDDIYLKTSGSMETGEGFKAKVEEGSGKIHVDSDLKGLK
ncbi:glycoside hydrolase family protein [Pedobacter psychrophilus]|nr:hypothetical protein [Pedobacter psychrophilus]